MNIIEIEKHGLHFRVIDPSSVSIKHYSPTIWTEEEPCFEAWCKGIRPGDVVIDAGAAFGNYTLPALAAGARVIAYEVQTIRQSDSRKFIIAQYHPEPRPAA
jgi:tRNA A58 N-methylase Trm61